jgi:ParB-like chromosome segregation protein Spo0J
MKKGECLPVGIPPLIPRIASRISMLPLHPITSDYHDFTDDEFMALRKDIRKCGLQVPIVIWNGQIVDGRHRSRACDELKIKPRYDDISSKTEDEMISFVRSLNQHRRSNTKPLTNADKKARIESALKKDPARSDPAIAAECGVALSTVQRTRKQLESQGVTEKVTPSERKSKSGKKGEGQHKAAQGGSAPRKKNKDTPPPLSSLAWANAAAHQRTKFISDVGVKSILAAMTNEHKEQLYKIIDVEPKAAATNPLPPELANLKPGEMPDIPPFLKRGNK